LQILAFRRALRSLGSDLRPGSKQCRQVGHLHFSLQDVFMASPNMARFAR
jgi:hypothetical protein